MRQVVIGKQGTQPFPINDPNVSRLHAVLYIDDNTGKLTLVDSDSTNGTYIYNGAQFMRIPPQQPVPVRPDTMIRLGPETRFHISRILPQQSMMPPKKEPEKPKKYNISDLREVSENYQTRKLELENKLSSLNGMRSFTIVGSVVASGVSAILGKAFGLDEVGSAILMVSLMVVLITSLVLIINHSIKKVTAERNENEREYAVKFCCPKCHYSFRGKYYENILASGRCPNCKSEYHEGN